jgi:hypothetical protein
MEITDMIGAVVAFVLGCAFLACIGLVLKLIYRAFMLGWGLI